jgi:predicted deacetylase
MRLIFRYDDFSAAERQSYEVDAAVFQVFHGLNVPLVVGVTPRMSRQIRDGANTVFDDLEDDARRIALLQQGLADGWQLALHGYTHQSTARIRGSEFAQEPHAAQQAKIQAGLDVLRCCFPGTPVEVFIPPWNSFDQATLDCLAEAGFKIVGVGAEKLPVERRDLVLAPSLLSARELVDYVRCYSLADLIETVGEARLVVTLHEYEFRLTGRADTLTVSDLTEVLQQVCVAGVLTDTLSITDVDFRPRHFRSFQAKVFLLQQVAHEHGARLFKRAQILDRRWPRAGAVTTLAHFWWVEAQCEALIRRRLRFLKRAYRRLAAQGR